MGKVPADKPLRLLVIATIAGLAFIGVESLSTAGAQGGRAPDGALARVAAAPAEVTLGQPAVPAPLPAAVSAVQEVVDLPGGGTRVFGHRRFLVAYYGTAGTGVLGVLGEADPDTMHRRLLKAAEPFGRDGEQVQPVYELIVTVADAVPGPDGDYSHDISDAAVRDYIAAAHRHGALVVLDLQPGRSDFLTVAQRWKWALQDPWVGLALDPEWRVGPRQVPAQVIGSVGAVEVNRVTRWLSGLKQRRGLPEKAFVLHQFRTSMIRNIDKVVDRKGLAMVQHVDGFGTQRQKLATYHAVARPDQFAMGFKLFYDEDVNLFSPQRVRKIRPAVRFVSYQ
ncbi:hypothetical protein ISU10_15345 [Nocardioides agariphilus]|uniref:Lipoprotein n=1 Tax=Nocardioides agariphilus TaxID=433664 RepID=A0A930VM13_9ACTN|nr:hypothetical protein [Nocardioides agariphilus]MBF4769142.1 hypothetical protein [Nocardioides agariphilus]